MIHTRLGSRKGVTLVELIITSTVVTIMILTVVPLFTTTTRGYSSMEVSTVLAAGCQEAVTKIQNRLAENKRLFGNDATGAAYLAKVTPSLPSSPDEGCLLSGSLLPTVGPNASLSPSSGTFVAGNVGNSILFAGVEQSESLDGILNGNGIAVNLRVDLFVFNYYYLSPHPTQKIAGKTVLDLWEWHSIPYVDYLGLTGITDVTLRNNVITALVSRGYAHAFNSSAPATSAFYSLSASSPWLALQAGHNVVQNNSSLGGLHIWQNDSKKMINLIRDISAGGSVGGSYVYSVSPNTGADFTHKYAVPNYGAASGDYFPAGFETMIVGASGNRRVLTRLVMAAQGSFKGYISHEQVLLAATRDLY